MKIYNFSQLQQLFPFGRTKLYSLLRAGILPVVKIGKNYVTSPQCISEWLKNNAGRELKY